MGRPKFDARISLKKRGGKSVRIDLWRLLDRSFDVWVNGKRSTKIKRGSATEIAKRLRDWIRSI